MENSSKRSRIVGPFILLSLGLMTLVGCGGDGDGNPFGEGPLFGGGSERKKPAPLTVDIAVGRWMAPDGQLRVVGDVANGRHPMTATLTVRPNCSHEAVECSGDSSKVLAEREASVGENGIFELEATVSSDAVLVEVEVVDSRGATGGIGGSRVEVDDPSDDVYVALEKGDLADICEERCPIIEGDLHVVTVPGLEDLEALESLEEVTGEIVLSGNRSLRSLRGLDSLRKVQDFGISLQPHLEQLDGLGGLEEVRHFWLSSNQALSSLEGLERPVSAASVRLKDNNALDDLAGIDAFDSIEELLVKKNDGLEDFAGGLSVQQLEQLHVVNNDRLESFAGATSLRKIGSLHIKNNEGLTSLRGLENIRELDRLGVARNPNLLTCKAEKLEEIERPPRYSSIDRNDYGDCS